jgi:alkylated DNA repair dioxygenase AlkB
VIPSRNNGANVTIPAECSVQAGEYLRPISPVPALSKMGGFVEHVLSDGSKFYVGRIPEKLLWDEATFEAAWCLHPREKQRIKIHGREVETPRWQQTFGVNYYYSGQVNRARPIPAMLEPLLAWSKRSVDPRLDGILCNWYEGPDQYIGQHHDSRKGIVRGTPIVTISFGETRIFQLTRGNGAAAEERDFSAPAGTVFVMPYDTNLAWQHGVPKSRRYRGRRISVTLRAFSSGVI